MQQSITRLAAFIFLALIGSSAFAAPILNIVGGQLVGASGVNVNGALYDVEFRDGTCPALFFGCDSNDDFFFKTDAEAIAASSALLDQVFIGVYDSNPELTSGITETFVAEALTPTRIDLNLHGVVAINFSLASGNADQLATFGISDPAFDTSGESQVVYAVWSQSQVPEPATLALLGAGLLGLGVSRRRQFRKPASIQ